MSRLHIGPARLSIVSSRSRSGRLNRRSAYLSKAASATTRVWDQRARATSCKNTKRSHCQICFLTMSHSCFSHPQNDDEQDMPKLTGQRATTKARHNRQQRYREKQRQYVDRLETTVKRLRMDVDQRLIKRLNIQRAAPIRPKASNVVACMRECMKTFESGTRDQQTQFLMSGTCSDVRFEDHIGREYILEQWADFACFLNEAAPMLEHCEFSADILDQDVSVGHVSALLVLRPTRRSLATLFPHCFSNMRLRDRMLQSPSIRLPMTVLFQFDEQGKVCRYAPTIDFVTGLYAVIRDYRDVASILESANINASGQIRGGLSSVAMSQVGISYCGDNGHYRTETEPSCPRSTTSHVDKLSVGFPFSSDEDTRPS